MSRPSRIMDGMNATPTPANAPEQSPRFETGILESDLTISLEKALAAWRREAEFREFDCAHYRCRFFVWGRGQTLLFVHGLSDQGRSFVPLIAHLTNSFRCIAYDLPTGHGDSANLDRLK